MATKKRVRGAADDERKSRGRFMDQPGQWIDKTPKSTKKRQAGDWKKLEKMMGGKSNGKRK